VRNVNVVVNVWKTYNNSSERFEVRGWTRERNSRKNFLSSLNFISPTPNPQPLTSNFKPPHAHPSIHLSSISTRENSPRGGGARCEKRAAVRGVPYLDVGTTPVTLEAVKKIPESAARAAFAVGLQSKDRTFAIGVYDPSAPDTKNSSKI